MVLLVAVSKSQSISKINQAIKLGQLIFGENYLQEALPKIITVKNNFPSAPISWHFMGKIQSNKIKNITTYFDWVQSLDNIKTAVKLNNLRPINLPPLQICIEINNQKLPRKPGITLSELPEFIQQLKTLPRLQWRGLMSTITEEYESVSKIFYDLKKQGHNLDTLSMGMSHDYQTAIKLGATMIRIGTAFFGKRQIQENLT